jgi:hypothetical protein
MILVESGNSNKYWETVDAKLQTARERKKDNEKLTRYFARILSNDRKRHGGDNQGDSDLHNGVPSDLVQGLADTVS